MNPTWTDARRALVALGTGGGLVALVAAWVTLQEPAHGPPAEAKTAVAAPKVEIDKPELAPKKDAPKEKEKEEEKEPEKDVPVIPHVPDLKEMREEIEKQIAELRTSPPIPVTESIPDPLWPVVAEVPPQAPVNATEIAGPAEVLAAAAASVVPPAALAPAPVSSTSPATPDGVGGTATITPTPYDPRSVLVRFASLDDLGWLVDAHEVEVVVEYPDTQRFLLPRDLGTARGAPRVSDRVFEGWVAEGRVSELLPSTELRRRVDVQAANIRFLAVLDRELRRRVAEEIAGAETGSGPVVVTLRRGPRVETVASDDP